MFIFLKKFKEIRNAIVDIIQLIRSNEQQINTRDLKVANNIKSSLNEDWCHVGNDLRNVLVKWKKSYVKK